MKKLFILALIALTGAKIGAAVARPSINDKVKKFENDWAQNKISALTFFEQVQDPETLKIFESLDPNFQNHIISDLLRDYNNRFGQIQKKQPSAKEYLEKIAKLSLIPKYDNSGLRFENESAAASRFRDISDKIENFTINGLESLFTVYWAKYDRNQFLDALVTEYLQFNDFDSIKNIILNNPTITPENGYFVHIEKFGKIISWAISKWGLPLVSSGGLTDLQKEFILDFTKDKFFDRDMFLFGLDYTNHSKWIDFFIENKNSVGDQIFIKSLEAIKSRGPQSTTTKPKAEPQAAARKAACCT